MTGGDFEAGCIFCKIIRGEIPCQRVWESEHVLAFLDIQPLAVGHTVIVPKHHVPSLEDLPESWAQRLGPSLGLVAGVVARVVGAEGYNVLQNNGAIAGQVVPHVHFHVVPRRPGDGLGYRWKTRAASGAELEGLAGRIRQAF
jgi:histidine triad (HIT) family protein